MSTAAHPATLAPSARHFLLRRLHSLTGLVFGGYILVHLVVNATLAEGSRHHGEPTVFQQQVDKIHSLPFLPAVEWAAIYLPIIYHTLYGVWITFAGQPNIAHYPYKRNVFYTLQRVSAMIIVAFLLFHVLGMKGALGSYLEFEPVGKATESTVRHINAHWAIAYLVYPVGVLASCFHLANGFNTAAITWGLAVSARAQQRWGMVCVGIFVLALGAGLTAWVAALRTAIVVQ